MGGCSGGGDGGGGEGARTMTALIDARVCIVTEYPKLAPIEDANAAPVLIVETSSAALSPEHESIKAGAPPSLVL